MIRKFFPRNTDPVSCILIQWHESCLNSSPPKRFRVLLNQDGRDRDGIYANQNMADINEAALGILVKKTGNNECADCEASGKI